MIIFSPFWVVPILLAAAVAWIRKDLRREMLWAGLLAVPVLALPPLLFGFYSNETFSLSSTELLSLIWRILFSFALGALASALYETFLGKHLRFQNTGSRQHLTLLLIGPALFFVLLILLDQNLFASLAISLLVDIAIVLVIRSDLFWDAAFSAFAMGVFYVLLYLLTFRGVVRTSVVPILGSEPIGLTLVGVPIEEVVIILLFGALWGPLYAAVKRVVEK